MKDSKHECADNGNDRIVIAEKGNGVCLVGVKEACYCGCDAVYLRECAYSHKTNAGTEECKYLCKPLPLYAHALFYVVERPAENVTVLIDCAVLYCKEALGILCCHSEKCSHPHPEKCAGTACQNTYCGCNADNVSCSDSCRKGCAE